MLPNHTLRSAFQGHNRYYFTERFARSKCGFSSKKYFVRQNLYLSVVRLRTLKHKKSPLFCMYVDERMLKELIHCQVQNYHVYHRAVSHQLYGNPNNHFHVRSLGVQYLLHNPEQFIESNTDHSWQGYLSNMSCQGTWADAIIIQAVANCVNLSIHIAESNETFAPVTVVQPVNARRGCTNIYIGQFFSRTV